MGKNKETYVAKPMAMPIFGAQDAGKTYQLERWINQQSRTVIVYNFGRLTDWKGYEYVTLSFVKKELYFEYKGNQLLFKKYFVKKYGGKRIKVRMFQERNDELRFLSIISETTEELMIKGRTDIRFILVLEDATACFSHTLPRAMKVVLSRSKHLGIWLFFLLHIPSKFPLDAYDLCTHIRIFKTNNSFPYPKDKEKIAEIQFMRRLNQIWQEVQDLPQYSYGTLDSKARKIHYTKPK